MASLRCASTMELFPIFLKKTKKGRLMKRLKNVQKMKTVEKAIAMNEKYAEKSSKIKSVYVMFS
ncbi:hypothetical protein ERO13_A01G068700v2 [Gossypium hirsutum]|uniref:Uncharacterized protein n=1 Tax=Gossypium darwinii TaxID=34276 RepID=A0A5D2HJ75_GOSDA|nr:hypothetical protein ERO13_A01G068700v2 [Gossypium hirsutum]KAG4213640.1 hypothetical protein ERO13_A01G068700v2 [Gossypium hirsutum]KAG4213641.1 hypothetical protein ERO13_A01G068700v2 [Gossypium hirsutum]TYH30212.1 hypothetical protein ES288_A01G076300v1 [Gossypium darwinii]